MWALQGLTLPGLSWKGTVTWSHFCLSHGADGIPFFCSANGVILTPGNAEGFLLPKYFKEALQLRPTREKQTTPHPGLKPGPFRPHALWKLPTLGKGSFLLATFISTSGKPLSLAGDKETETQSGPKLGSRGGRRKIQQ